VQKKAPFKLNAENAALDFVNTLDDRFAPGGPHELLTVYRLIERRGPASEDRIALEGWAALCRKHRELRWEDDHLAWRWMGLAANPDAPAMLLADLALSLLTEDPPAHLHVCASDTCRWLFLDTSKNRTRRWCDMKICGNRAKARRYSAAHQN